MRLYKPCVFIAAETWIKSDDDISIEDYTIVHRVNVLQNRKRHAYGLVIYCRQDKQFSVHYNYNNEEKFQSCSLITGVFNNIAICTGYKPPSTKYSTIKIKIEELILAAEEKSEKIIFLGDFNIDYNNERSHSFFKMLDLKKLQTALRNNVCTTNSSTAIDI